MVVLLYLMSIHNDPVIELLVICRVSLHYSAVAAVPLQQRKQQQPCHHSMMMHKLQQLSSSRGNATLYEKSTSEHLFLVLQFVTYRGLYRPVARSGFGGGAFREKVDT